VSPVKCTVVRLSAHGPVGRPCWPLYPPACSDPYARENANPRPMFFDVSVAYCWLIHASGVTPGSEEYELSQHQSSHQKDAPCCSMVWCRSKYALSWSGLPQSKT